MPEMGYSEYVFSYDEPPVVDQPKHSFFSPDFDVLPYRSEKYRGQVVCTSHIIDALRGMSVCRIEDEKGDILAFSIWKVDLDPRKPLRAVSEEQAPVQYKFGYRVDFFDSDVRAYAGELKEKIDKYGRDKKYAVVEGYIYPPKEFAAMIDASPQKRQLHKEVAKLEEEMMEKFEQDLKKLGLA